MLTQVFRSQLAKVEADVIDGSGSSHGIQHRMECVDEASHHIVPAAAWRPSVATCPCCFKVAEQLTPSQTNVSREQQSIAAFWQAAQLCCASAYSSSLFQRKQAKAGLLPDWGSSRRRPALSLQYQTCKLLAEVQQRLVQLHTFIDWQHVLKLACYMWTGCCRYMAMHSCQLALRQPSGRGLVQHSQLQRQLGQLATAQTAHQSTVVRTNPGMSFSGGAPSAQSAGVGQLCASTDSCECCLCRLFIRSSAAPRRGAMHRRNREGKSPCSRTGRH